MLAQKTGQALTYAKLVLGVMVMSLSFSVQAQETLSVDTTISDTTRVWDWDEYSDEREAFDLYLDEILPTEGKDLGEFTTQIALGGAELVVGVAVLKGSWRMTRPILNWFAPKSKSVRNEMAALQNDLDKLRKDINKMGAQEGRGAEKMSQLQQQFEQKNNRLATLMNKELRGVETRTGRAFRGSMRGGAYAVRFLGVGAFIYAVAEVGSRIYIWNYTDNSPEVAPLFEISVDQLDRAMSETEADEQLREMVERLDSLYEATRDRIRERRQRDTLNSDTVGEG